MKGLDLNKFKKVREDQQTATLSHPHGHEIKIAKSALSKTLRDQLDDLPYAKGGEVKEHNPSKFAEDYAKKHAEKFPKPIPKEKQSTGPNGPIGAQRSEAFLSRAKGGDVKGVHEPYGDRNITHTMSEKEREGASLAGEAVRAGSRGDESGRRVGKSEHKRVLEEMRSMKKPHLMAHGGYMPMAEGEDVESPEQASVGQSYPAIETEQVQSNPMDHVLNAADEFDKWQNDKENGHIEPRKMSDYFADASVPGKLGMIFGAMAGGIGSGLTHQPSAFLTMMQKQIDNDMEAQKASKEFGYKANVLAMHQRETDAKIKQMAIQNGWTKAQTAGALIANKQQNYAFQRMVKNQEYAEGFLKDTQAMPDGPQKQARMAALPLVFGMINNENIGIKERANAAVMMNQEPQEPQPSQTPQPLGMAPSGESGASAAQPQATPEPMPGPVRVLSPDSAQKYKMIPFTGSVRTPQQQSVLQHQYDQAVQTDKALAQIEQLYPELMQNATYGGYFSRKIPPHALAGVAAGIGTIMGGLPGTALGAGLGEAVGYGAKSGLRAIGGHTETRYETAKASLEGYIGNALAGLKVTPTEIKELADEFAPTAMDNRGDAINKLRKLQEKIVTLTDTSALDSAKMTNKRK